MNTLKSNSKLKRNRAYQVAMIGMFASLAIILGYVETLLPIQLGIPGIKLGLANIVIVFVIYTLGGTAAFVVNFIRILVINSMFGTIMTLLFSLCGGILSLLVMLLVKRCSGIHLLSVSICGGIAHNVAQIIVASIFVKNSIVLLYLPIISIGGIVTGVLIGWMAGILLKKLQTIPFNMYL